MTEQVDFTSCSRVPGRAYNGANGKKIAVNWRGACWILKFPPSAADRPNDLSYSNSCFSEHIASTVFGMLMDSGRDVAFEYDFTFAAGPNGWHTLSVAGEGANPKEDDLRRLAESVGIADEVAHEEYVRIVDVCGELKE